MKESIWLGWTVRESGKDGFRQIYGDNGHAYGKYQFDYRYGLIPFMQYCQENSGNYNEFDQFIALGKANIKLIRNTSLGELWLRYCNTYPEEFEELQDEAAYEQYYIPMKTYCSKYGITIDNYHMAIKGSLFSMAIRSGALTAATKMRSAINAGKKSDDSILRYVYGTYGSSDSNRWTEKGQLGDALKVLKNNTSKSDLYKVGTMWESGKCIDQKGAFTVLENAKSCRNEHGDNYYVFNSVGRIVYPELKNQLYRVGTSWNNGKCINQHGAFKEMSNAIADCKQAASDNDRVYYVFDNTGKVVHTEQITGRLYRVGTSWNNGKCIDQKGAFNELVNAKKCADNYAEKLHKKFNVYDEDGSVVYYRIAVFKEYQIKTLRSLRIYTAASENSVPVGESTGIGVFGIVEEVYDKDNILWGRLKSGAGWICLQYTVKR